MVEILVPIARRDLVLNAHEVPAALQGKLSAVLRSEKEIDDLAHAMGGRSAKPRKPVMVWGPDDRTVLLIVGDGVAEAAEIEELAHAQLEKAQRNVKKYGRAYDFAGARERAGLPEVGEFDNLYRDALRRRRAEHKASPFSDPARQPERPDTGRKVHG